MLELHCAEFHIDSDHAAAAGRFWWCIINSECSVGHTLFKVMSESDCLCFRPGDYACCSVMLRLLAYSLSSIFVAERKVSLSPSISVQDIRDGFVSSQLVCERVMQLHKPCGNFKNLQWKWAFHRGGRYPAVCGDEMKQNLQNSEHRNHIGLKLWCKGESYVSRGNTSTSEHRIDDQVCSCCYFIHFFIFPYWSCLNLFFFCLWLTVTKHPGKTLWNLIQFH